MTLRGEVKELAIKGLRKCYGPYGIYAGTHQFRDYWARDGLWACIGGLRLQDMFHIKRTIRLFLHFEKDGYIPLRIGNKHFFQTYIGFKSTHLHARYREDKSENYSTDSATLLILALSEYLKKTNDHTFIIKYLPRVKKIIEGLMRHTNDERLIEEKHYSTWMDSIKKEGTIFYSNVLFYISLERFEDICNKMHLHSTLPSKKVLEIIKKNINKRFWNGEYFIDWIGNNDQEYFDTFANLIALYFDFTTPQQKKKIFQYIKDNNIIKEDGTILKSFPDYNEKYISEKMNAMGMRDYCSKITYPWMSFFYYACICKENGKEDEGWDELCKRTIKDKDIYECYNQKLKPYKKLFYKAEHPFAWGCAFVLLTIRKD